MIYCIAGPPRVGKSTLGRRVAAKLGLACLPTDTIRVALETAVTESDRANRFPVSRYRRAVAERGATSLTTIPVAELVAAYHTEAMSCWPALAAILTFTANRHESLVVEGCQLWPSPLAAFETVRKTQKLRVVVLTRTDRAATEQAMVERQLEPGWLVDDDRSPLLVNRYAELITMLGAEFAAEAEAADWPVISVDGDFDPALADAEATLVGP